MENKMKIVTFNESDNQIHVMYAWSYAYRNARKGHWHLYSVDKERFQRKIKETFEPIITQVLDYNHREKIYKKLIENESNYH